MQRTGKKIDHRRTLGGFMPSTKLSQISAVLLGHYHTSIQLKNEVSNDMDRENHQKAEN